MLVQSIILYSWLPGGLGIAEQITGMPNPGGKKHEPEQSTEQLIRNKLIPSQIARLPSFMLPKYSVVQPDLFASKSPVDTVQLLSK